MLSEHFEKDIINILLIRIKTKFVFFQIEIEGIFVKAPEADKAAFGKGPKVFYPIEMGMLIAN